MGLILAQQEKHDEAMDMYKRALAIKIKAYGPEHADVGQVWQSLSCLSVPYADLCKLSPLRLTL